MIIISCKQCLSRRYLRLAWAAACAAGQHKADSKDEYDANFKPGVANNIALTLCYKPMYTVPVADNKVGKCRSRDAQHSQKDPARIAATAQILNTSN